MEKLPELLAFAVRTLDAWMENHPGASDLKVRGHIAEISYALAQGLTFKEALMIVFNDNEVQVKRIELTVPRAVAESFAKGIVIGYIQEAMLVQYLRSVAVQNLTTASASN